MVRSEIEAVLRCENYVQVVVDFSMLYVVTRRLLLSSRISLLVINLLTIRERVLPLIQIVQGFWRDLNT